MMRSLILLGILLLTLSAVKAETTSLPSLEQPWPGSVLYKDNANPFLQEVAIQGRFMLQYAESSDAGISHGTRDAPEFTRWGEHLEVRRWRIGPRIRFFDQWLLDGHINISPDWQPFYLNIYDVQLTWMHSPAFNVSLGKSKVPYTQEYAISSARIPTVERSLLTNQIITTPLTGLTIFGEKDHWRYRLGLYANDPRPLGEFSHFNAGYALLMKLAHDFGPQLKVDHAWIGVDAFLHTEPPNNGQPAYTRSLALTSEIIHDAWGFLGDVLYSGGEGIDNFGLTLLPTWRFHPKWQIVARYHAACSTGGDGISPPIRYDRFVGETTAALTSDGRGDFAQTAYLGVNHFIRGHYLKLMTGIEYLKLEGGRSGGGYDGWTFFSGLRVLF